ncbi:TadE/TadG family type IV pilus assembly protein [Alicyclobacillus mengziensis]|uniref:Pilus assembly protein n=1 Tax=Alicyclobacillus mengziensis TaxID=2931921 RepID=A0A9X7Z6N4_9BACL|nr:TadE/TadG family type IV pilus assembly protein [Alicyclobacillus mengziensis]QSO48169.1 pilus assembly protein [Alicyclobacillus mengziensis]
MPGQSERGNVRQFRVKKRVILPWSTASHGAAAGHTCHGKSGVRARCAGRGNALLEQENTLVQQGNTPKVQGNGRGGRDGAGERGQSLVEFALVLPILLLLLLGIIDFGRVLSAYYVVDHAARDAVRYASVGASDSTVIQAIQNDTAALTATPSYTISPPADGRVSGEPVTVTVSVPVKIIDPIMAAILGSTYTASASVQMRVE